MILFLITIYIYTLINLYLVHQTFYKLNNKHPYVRKETIKNEKEKIKKLTIYNYTVSYFVLIEPE